MPRSSSAENGRAKQRHLLGGPRALSMVSIRNNLVWADLQAKRPTSCKVQYVQRVDWESKTRNYIDDRPLSPTFSPHEKFNCRAHVSHGQNSLC